MYTFKIYSHTVFSQTRIIQTRRKACLFRIFRRMRSCSIFNTTAPTFAKIYRKIHALRCVAIFNELILDKTRQNRRTTKRFTEDFNAVLDKISHLKSGSDYSRLAIVSLGLRRCAIRFFY